MASVAVRVRPWLVVGQAAAAFIAVALLIFPSIYSEYGLVVAALAWLLGWLASGRLWPGTAVDLPVVAIMLIALGSLLWVSADRNLSWLAFCQLTAGIFTFCTIIQIARSRDAVVAMTALLLLLGVALAVYGLAASTWWQAQKFIHLPAAILRLRPQVPEIINANILGGALMPLIAIVSALFLFGHPTGGRRKRWLLWTGLLLAWLTMTAMLGLTQSRGAWLGLAVGLFILALVRTRWAALLVPVALVIAMSVGPGRIMQLAVANQTLSSWEGRQEVWSRAVYMIQDFPFTGIGIGTFGRVAPILYPFFIGSNEEGAIAHAHNLTLQVAVDLGLFGLVAFTALFTACLIMAMRSWHRLRTHDRNLSALALGLAVALVGILVHGLLDTPLWQAKTTVILWAVLGLSVALHQVACGPQVMSSDTTTRSGA